MRIICPEVGSLRRYVSHHEICYPVRRCKNANLILPSCTPVLHLPQCLRRLLSYFRSRTVASTAREQKTKPAHQSAEDRRRLSPPCAGVEQLAAAAQLLCSVVAVAFPFLVLFSTTCSLSPSGCAFGLTFSFFFPFFFLVRQASPSLRFLAETRNCWGLTRTLDGPFSTVSKLMFETEY